jgi:hypothetical protein
VIDVSSVDQVPPPAVGSTAWFVLLYGGAQRARMQALFALARELAASFDPGLDHDVAHVRLAWWREEAERTARGEARHPYTRLLQHTALELEGLLSAAQLQLARESLPASAAEPIPPEPFARGVFLAAAQVLHGAPLPGPLRAAVRAWAERMTTGAGLSRGVTGAHAPWQQAPTLAPLAVWVTLARDRGPSPWAVTTAWPLFKDNLRAWRAARAATRGRFQ